MDHNTLGIMAGREGGRERGGDRKGRKEGGKEEKGREREDKILYRDSDIDV